MADDNAIARARTPHWARFMAEAPHALIEASALDVGLPEGQMGNSEVGHMNLGAGRVVMQDMPRIDAAIRDGSLARNPALLNFLAALRASGGTCHLMGLISPGGVHSHQDEIAALARLVGEAGIPVALHGFLDGRDTPPQSALDYLQSLARATDGVAGPGLVTLVGRYFAMDRDKRWERVERAFRLIVDAEGLAAESAGAAVEVAYARGETDEFVQPTVIGSYEGLRDGDGILMGNFRADRAREILTALTDPAFDGFARARTPRLAACLGLTEYSAALATRMETLFPPEPLDRILGQTLAEHGKTQLRIAETEKYAHVTFFFNGGSDEAFPGEERILVPSPRVATYDLQPEMSAPEVTDRLVAAIDEGRFDFILVNYANGDMVGHTGQIDAAIRAVETVDTCLGRVAEAVTRAGGTLLITADHGNAEQMFDPATGQPHTAHTTNKVPLILVNGPEWARGIADGRLADIAPTVLDLMALAQPGEMTGRSLLIHAAGDVRSRDALASA